MSEYAPSKLLLSEVRIYRKISLVYKWKRSSCCYKGLEILTEKGFSINVHDAQ